VATTVGGAQIHSDPQPRRHIGSPLSSGRHVGASSLGALLSRQRFCLCAWNPSPPPNTKNQVLYDFKFDWRYMVRGLTIDKHRGNVLKIDRHKYVKLAYHGFRQLSREERLSTYSNAEVPPPPGARQS
jgi:5' nucleotidase family